MLLNFFLTWTFVTIDSFRQTNQFLIHNLEKIISCVFSIIGKAENYQCMVSYMNAIEILFT